MLLLSLFYSSIFLLIAATFAMGILVISCRRLTHRTGSDVSPSRAKTSVRTRHAAVAITVGEDEILAAMAHYFTDTHNIAEGAGAVPLAALLQTKADFAGQRAGPVRYGGNVDRALMTRALD